MTAPPKPEVKHLPRLYGERSPLGGYIADEHEGNHKHVWISDPEHQALVKEAVAKAKSEAWDSALEYCAEFITRPADCSPDAIVAAAWFRAKKARKA